MTTPRNTYEMLEHVKQDIGWRIECAAREADAEALDAFMPLTDAIQRALDFSDLRAGSPRAEP